MPEHSWKEEMARSAPLCLYLLIRDHGFSPTVVHAKMCRAWVDNWETNDTGGLCRIPSDGCLQQQPVEPASFILMNPPEEYPGCRGAGEVFQTGARCSPPNFSVKYQSRYCFDTGDGLLLGHNMGVEGNGY